MSGPKDNILSYQFAILPLWSLPRPLPYIDTVPTWLGPGLMLFGVAAIVLWGFRQFLERISIGNDYQKFCLGVLFTLGVVFSAAGELAASNLVAGYGVILFAAGRFIEGGAAVRGARKIVHILRHRTFPGGSGSLKKKLRYYGIRMSITVASFTLFWLVIFRNIENGSPLYELTLITTISAFLLAVMGLSWKLESAENSFDSILIAGLLMMFAGTTIFGYANLVWTTITIISGTLAFISGVVVSLVALRYKNVISGNDSAAL